MNIRDPYKDIRKHGRMDIYKEVQIKDVQVREVGNKDI